MLIPSFGTSTPVLQQQHVQFKLKELGHSAKNAGGRLWYSITIRTVTSLSRFSVNLLFILKKSVAYTEKDEIN